MSNNGRITICPYYRDEKNLSISCEDTYRRFRWLAQKKQWMDLYCDKSWGDCPFAQELNDLYRKMEEDCMGSKNLETEHKLKASEKERRKLSSMLGKAEKREKEKDKEIRALRKRNRVLEAFYTKNKPLLDGMLQKEEQMLEEMHVISGIYEARIAYLMAIFSNGVLDEIAMKEWLAAHEYRIQPEYVAEDTQRKTDIVAGWRVHVKEIEEESK